MEKRLVIAFLLSIAVVFAFQKLFSPPPPVQDSATVVQSPSTSATPTAPPAEKVPAEKTETPALPAIRDVKAEKLEDFDFPTPLYTATISNIGGVLKSYHLRAYSDGEGRPLELINHEYSNK